MRHDQTIIWLATFIKLTRKKAKIASVQNTAKYYIGLATIIFKGQTTWSQVGFIYLFFGLKVGYIIVAVICIWLRLMTVILMTNEYLFTKRLTNMGKLIRKLLTRVGNLCRIWGEYEMKWVLVWFLLWGGNSVSH